MIPYDWTPYRRPADGELVGYLAADGGRAVPLTVFGSPLAGPLDWADAIAVLERDGLASLAAPWRLALDDGSEVPVRILSAFPDRVELVRADLGYYDSDSDRYTLAVPVDGRLGRG